jgi:hypothetical protein
MAGRFSEQLIGLGNDRPMLTMDHRPISDAQSQGVGADTSIATTGGQVTNPVVGLVVLGGVVFGLGYLWNKGRRAAG